ncbi:MAG: hypothetical protein M0P33_04445 [Massilibacteroides sp.]|nr:hypothetical protein [Massilibacteroides sp.]
MKKVMVLCMAGLLSTALMFGQEAQQGRRGGHPKGEMNVERLAKRLELNESQTAQLKTFFENQTAERKAEMADRKADRETQKAKMEERQASVDVEMKSVLTPEQYTKWASMKKKAGSKRSSKRGQE